MRMKLFPHLYRCGHIEAGIQIANKIYFVFDFRIFIDAATLKLGLSDDDARAWESNFRIFIDAATLKLIAILHASRK